MSDALAAVAGLEAADGQIVRFVERFDPAVLSAAFGDTLSQTFSLKVDR